MSVREAAGAVRMAGYEVDRALLLLEEVSVPGDLVRRLERLSRELALAFEEVSAEIP